MSLELTKRVGDVFRLTLHPDGPLYAQPEWTINYEGVTSVVADVDQFGATVTCIGEGYNIIEVDALVTATAGISASVDLIVLPAEATATDLRITEG